ncbi:MAG: hypothetical protein DWQ34_19855 [Planctomycetota bacterium]|nr:MAG: hypothetical protein DWQ29_11910 [Planctomycetota bacterium]REJ89506.1 MAG: hypothetical protein DWQ34_19855 [Planctomycetota bacterium]REK28923.1 MAG: hypothetical protein DWQ41_05060 [Planctomycetota bacterium]REK39643.1 MAG: hypothetical protein DWQ45_01885 [Planctomycetota bacterium]
MNGPLIVDLISRWIHVGAAIVLLGGSIFMRFVLMPSAAALTESEHEKLRERILLRWKKLVMAGITLLLLTGFYNYLAGDPPSPRYHMLMGIKILLALAVFFLASAITGRSSALQPIRQNRAWWLTVLIALASVVVAIAGYLKVAAAG